MNLDDWQLIFASLCIVLILLASIPLIDIYLPQRKESFMALAVLGENGKAEKYYPNDSPIIEVGEDLHWTIYLYNHMGKIQYVALRVKLLNSTISAPNSSICTPSIAPLVYEIRRLVLNNETLLIPFSWAILNVEEIGNFLDIRSLSLNGDIVDIHSLALHGFNYRVVMELWIYDKELEDFRFGWFNDKEMRCAWNQIWFNVTKSS